MNRSSISRKKVLYILHGIQIGGVEVALVSAIPRLNREFDLQVIALGKINDRITASLTPDEKSRLHAFDYPLYQYPFAVFGIISFVFKFNPDIMICSLWRASMIGIIVKSFQRKIQFFSFIHSAGFTHILNRVFSSMAVKIADHVLVDSKATADFVKSKIRPRAPIQIVSFCLEAQNINQELRELDPKEIRIMFLGRINPVKNLPKTIDAIHYLRSKGHNVSLDIYGKPEGTEQGLVEYIYQKGLVDQVHFKGELYHSQSKVMNDYHFLIQLSSREGMAMSVAEAMQNGLVCIVTPVGEIPNYSQDMQNAIFIDIQNQENWIPSLTKVEQVIRDPILYSSLSKASRKQFENVKIYSESLIEQLNAI
ncbi:glycosyltransferase family 4 protein [Dyadobacter sp. CY323]|uniref:glycosyltransferase family 4 protein n=1 Tax=Dyadobacter sp. CY323 TaxID=2907302 RepID=UPI001F4556D1|nr:glycosyltransferase family 4 protein [Dyadobacter sp. CY323]MCE6990969.1 glycosyltransferase family 4 protein [Dyadobacter sp. CY323]